MRRSVAVLFVAGMLAFALSCARTRSEGGADPYAGAPPYLRRIPGDTTTLIRPILTVGQRIPLTRGRGDYLVVGVPDGLGLHRDGERVILLSNHELVPDSGGPAGPLPGGARVSEFTLAIESDGSRATARAVSGRPAIERVYEGEASQPVAPGTRRFAKLCSATLADEGVGFDRPIFMTGEEWGKRGSFDRKGPQAVAVFEGEAHVLPRLGCFRMENQVPAPFTGSATVVFGLEDDDTRPQTGRLCQLYMYVGEKRPGAASALSINGLDNGSLYVFAADDSAVHGEQEFAAKGRRLPGHWVPVSWELDELGLEGAAQAVNAFDMIRVEDGAANPARAGEFWFVTTGGPAYAFNRFGRIYRLDFDPGRPTGAATLTLVLDGSEGIVSPDNIGINRHGELAICEDPNYDLSAAPLRLTRDTRLWIYDIASRDLTPVAEVGRDVAVAHAARVHSGKPVEASFGYRPGDWEVSGVVDAEEYLGRGSWILDVQAHTLRVEPVRETVEGGQYLHIVWSPK